METSLRAPVFPRDEGPHAVHGTFGPSPALGRRRSSEAVELDGLEVLSRAECMRLLSTEQLGRVGVSFGTALGGIANAESEHAHFLKKGSRGVNQTLALQVFGGSAHTNIAIEVRRDGEWAIIHRCTGCGMLKCNRVAGDDQERSLLALSLRPIASPAFPLDDIRS